MRLPKLALVLSAPGLVAEADVRLMWLEMQGGKFAALPIRDPTDKSKEKRHVYRPASPEQQTLVLKARGRCDAPRSEIPLDFFSPDNGEQINYNDKIKGVDGVHKNARGDCCVIMAIRNLCIDGEPFLHRDTISVNIGPFKRAGDKTTQRASQRAAGSAGPLGGAQGCLPDLLPNLLPDLLPDDSPPRTYAAPKRAHGADLDSEDTFPNIKLPRADEDGEFPQLIEDPPEGLNQVYLDSDLSKSAVIDFGSVIASSPHSPIDLCELHDDFSSVPLALWVLSLVRPPEVDNSEPSTAHAFCTPDSAEPAEEGL